jgi:hypothetical protein
MDLSGLGSIKLCLKKEAYLENSVRTNCSLQSQFLELFVTEKFGWGKDLWENEPWYI